MFCPLEIYNLPYKCSLKILVFARLNIVSLCPVLSMTAFSFPSLEMSAWFSRLNTVFKMLLNRGGLPVPAVVIILPLVQDNPVFYFLLTLSM